MESSVLAPNVVRCSLSPPGPVAFVDMCRRRRRCDVFFVSGLDSFAR